MPTGKRFTELPAYYKPGDKVRTAAGEAGTIIEETRNLFLLRPGRAYNVQLDAGEVITVNEHEIERVSAK